MTQTVMLRLKKISQSRLSYKMMFFLGMVYHILKEVRIVKGCIIGACCLVTKDILAGVIAAGVPCKVIRENDFNSNSTL